jgi:hypothetical protein
MLCKKILSYGVEMQPILWACKAVSLHQSRERIARAYRIAAWRLHFARFQIASLWSDWHPEQSKEVLNAIAILENLLPFLNPPGDGKTLTSGVPSFEPSNLEDVRGRELTNFLLFMIWRVI